MISLNTFRVTALAEATTFLALLTATVVRVSGGGATGVHILGPIHGVLFVAYVVIAANLRGAQGWTQREMTGVIVGAVLPFGGYVVERWLVRRSLAPAS